MEDSKGIGLLLLILYTNYNQIRFQTNTPKGVIYSNPRINLLSRPYLTNEAVFFKPNLACMFLR